MPAPNRKHPGVTLIKPGKAAKTQRQRWRARYIDPDTGKYKWETAPKSVTNAEQRKEWAIEIYERVEARRRALAAGARRKGEEPSIKAFVEVYEKEVVSKKKGRTEETYIAAVQVFLSWCEANSVTTVDGLSRGALRRFREARVNVPKTVAASGKKLGRGRRKASKEKRGAAAVNRELRAVKTLVRWGIKREDITTITFDDVTLGLELLTEPYDRPEYLKTPAIKKLLDAVVAHDAETFDLTREEHKRGVQPGEGTTPKFPAVAPFALTLLLTGMRRSEALSMEWAHIDLEAQEIYLPSEVTKTPRGRPVHLDVSPSLIELFKAIRPKKPKGRVFAHLTADEATNALSRLRDDYGATKDTTWKMLRSTCGTYLTNASGIYGGASAYQSAVRLGHSVAVAQKHYLGVIRNIPREAATLEAAMGIEDQVSAVVERVRG